jgi:hypothetical protein
MSNANILWNQIEVDHDVNVIAGLLVYNTGSKQLAIDPQRLASNRPFYGEIDKWLREEQTNGLYSHELLRWNLQSTCQRGRDFSTLVLTIVDVDTSNKRNDLFAGLRLDCLANPLMIEAVTLPQNEIEACQKAKPIALDRKHPDYKFIMDSRSYIFAAMLRAVASKIIDAVRS